MVRVCVLEKEGVEIRVDMVSSKKNGCAFLCAYAHASVCVCLCVSFRVYMCVHVCVCVFNLYVNG